jgi:hypothetical protein
MPKGIPTAFLVDYVTSFTSGGFQLPSRMDGGVSLGQ